MTSGASGDDRLDRGLFGRPEATRWARTMFESVPAAMTLRDRTTALIWANEAYEKLVGRTFEAMRGQKLTYIREGFDAEDKITNTEPSRFERLVYERPDGSEVVAEVVIQPLLDEDGDTAFVLAGVDRCDRSSPTRRTPRPG